MKQQSQFSSRRVHLIALLLWMFCSLSQAADRVQDCTDCPVLVSIPAGQFKMGAVGDPSAVPVHQVKLSYRFAIGQTEVTEAQFRFFLKRTGYNAGASHSTASFSPRQPAVEVDWYAASAYARWLSRYTGQRYRLPSEAEWDYVAHAGKPTRYWWGDAAVEGCGKEHLSLTFFPFDQPCASAQKAEVIEVAGLRANPWGIYDIQGNVGEWTQDCWNDNYNGVQTDGTPFSACEKESSTLRVARGPAFIDNAAPRRPVDGRERSATTGFRVVRELP